MKKFPAPKINKAKIFGFLILAAIVWFTGSWLAKNYDVALYAIQRPEDVRKAKAVREYLLKKADADFSRELSIK